MGVLLVYGIVLLMHCTLKEMVIGEKNLMKSSEYVLLYIICVSIIYISVSIMMEAWGKI